MIGLYFLQLLVKCVFRIVLVLLQKDGGGRRCPYFAFGNKRGQSSLMGSPEFQSVATARAQKVALAARALFLVRQLDDAFFWQRIMAIYCHLWPVMLPLYRPPHSPLPLLEDGLHLLRRAAINPAATSSLLLNLLHVVMVVWCFQLPQQHPNQRHASHSTNLAVGCRG